MKKMWTSISSTSKKNRFESQVAYRSVADVLQTVLKGKAQETYASFQLQTATTTKWGENQTYVEFFRQKETYLNRWIAAKGIGTDYDKLRQLILIEELNGAYMITSRHSSNERQVDTGYEMATLAEEYTLTHQRNQNKSEDPSEYRRSTKPRITTSTSSEDVAWSDKRFKHQPNRPESSFFYPSTYGRRKESDVLLL